MKTCVICLESKTSDQFEEKRQQCKKCRLEKKKNWSKLNLYSISHEQYLAMVDAQNSLCSICNLPQRGKNNQGREGVLHVDHDHTTGKVRGLLCHRCNTALGLFEDDEQRLLAAIDYLRNGVSQS